MLPTKFRVKWPFSSGEEAKIGTILAIFNLSATPMLPTKFQVDWLLGLGVEGKKRFSRWPPWWPSWVSDQHDFSFFDLQVTLMLPTVWCQLAFQLRRRSEKLIFKMAAMAAILEF